MDRQAGIAFLVLCAVAGILILSPCAMTPQPTIVVPQQTAGGPRVVLIESLREFESECDDGIDTVYYQAAFTSLPPGVTVSLVDPADPGHAPTRLCTTPCGATLLITCQVLSEGKWYNIDASPYPTLTSGFPGSHWSWIFELSHPQYGPWRQYVTFQRETGNLTMAREQQDRLLGFGQPQPPRVQRSPLQSSPQSTRAQDAKTSGKRFVPLSIIFIHP